MKPLMISICEYWIFYQQSEKKPISLDEWHDIATIFPMELVFDADTQETKALIQVSNVPQGVCQILVNDMYARSEIAINGYIIEDGSNADCTDNNTLDFYFGTNEPCGSTYCVAKAPYCHKESQTCKACITSEQCPSEKPRCYNFQCEACPNVCPKNQSQNYDDCSCYYDTSMYEKTPTGDGSCICKTEDVLALDLVSDAPNVSDDRDCRITVAELGYLNGTYYFEWINGYHYYDCATQSVGFSLFLFADDTNEGYILNVDKPSNHFVCYYQNPNGLTNALKNNPVKYFTFDGTQNITLQFWDDYCYDNDGTMELKLHKIVDYCDIES